MILSVPDNHAAVPAGEIAGVTSDLPARPRNVPVYLIMAGGGTGGHLYPGLAVAQQLDQLRSSTDPEIKVAWAATPRKIDQRLLGAAGADYIPQAVKPFSSNPLKWPAFYSAWHKSCGYWRDFFDCHQVAAVLALGGYAAGPAAYEAAKRNIPVGLLNPDALAGRANRFLMGRADIIFSQWPMGKSAEKYADRIRVAGCPVRASLVRMNRVVAAEKLALDPNRKTLVVTGASLGAQTINHAVAQLLSDPEIKHLLNGAGESRWQILHLTGLDHAAEMQAMAARRPQIHWKILDYCDDMAAVWSLADLAIARAGAGTCAELSCLGVPAILMPYPFHKDHHQQANAEKLCAAGSAVLVRDSKDPGHNAAELKPVLMRLLTETDRLGEMALAAHSQAKPDAAATVARWLLHQVQLKIGDQP